MFASERPEARFSRFKWSSLAVQFAIYITRSNKELWCSTHQHLAKMRTFTNSFSLAFCAPSHITQHNDGLPNVINYPADYRHNICKRCCSNRFSLGRWCCMPAGAACRFFIRASALLFAFFNPFEMTRRWCCLISYLAFLEHNKEISTLVWQDASPSICWYFSLRIYSECRAATKFIHVTPARRSSRSSTYYKTRASPSHIMQSARYEK